MKLNADDTERGTYRTQRANPNSKRKQGKSKRKLRGWGLQTKRSVREEMETQRFTSGLGRNPKLTRKHFQTDFKYRLQSTSLFLFGNGYWRGNEGLTDQQTQLKGEGGGGAGQKGPACPEPVGVFLRPEGWRAGHLEGMSPLPEEKNAFMPRRPESLMTKD